MDRRSKIDTLLDQITDQTLRARLAREVADLSSQRTFGLVFEKHIPESIRLPHALIRRGSTVMARDRADETTWKVTNITDGVAALRDEDGNTTDKPLADLVCARVFGQPVYPGLESTGSILGGGDTPHHIVISGENHHALQALKYTHNQSVDVIYIDPPYNTGGKTSWLYNDKYVETTDSYRHSKWLSFMEKRLVLARDLLKPTGVIFVSIGDDEQHRLRMLMDQVFGSTNHVAMLTVEMSTTSGPKTTNAQQGTIVKNCEFVLVYRRSPAFDEQVRHTPLLDGVPSWDTHYTLWLNDDGTLGSFIDNLTADPFVMAEIKQYGLVNRSGRFLGQKAMDKLLAVSEVAREFVANNLSRIARTDYPPAPAKSLDAPVGSVMEFDNEGRTYLITRLSTGTIQQVYTLDRNYRTSDDYAPRFGRTVIRGDLWKGFYQDMGNVAKEGGVKFANGKKPIRLIKQLVRWANNSPDAVILDFFAGSGTTTHAVMSMNAEDGGRRQSIIVTNNEVGLDDAKRLTRAGLAPGHPDWEKRGVFEAVTRPRIGSVVEEFEANVTFADLTYLDRTDVERGRAFQQIAYLLWAQSGGRGAVITEQTESYAVPQDGHYGVLFEVDQWHGFVQAVRSRDDLTHAFVVTDSDAAFNHVERALPDALKVVRLYENYLSTFEINTREY